MSAAAAGVGVEPTLPGVATLGGVLARGAFSHSAIRTTAAVAILLLSACADKPPIVSADTSCERFRHISATDAQIKVFADNWDVMESYADQIVSHNVEYEAQCLKVEK